MTFVGVANIVSLLSGLIRINQEQVDEARILLSGYRNNETPSPYVVQAVSTITSSLGRYYQKYGIQNPNNLFVGPAQTVLQTLDAISSQINEIRDGNNKFVLAIFKLAGNFPITGQSLKDLISYGRASNDTNLQRTARDVEEFFNAVIQNGAISFESTSVRIAQSTARLLFMSSISKCIELLMMIRPDKPVLPSTGLPYSWSNRSTLINQSTLWYTNWFITAANNLFNTVLAYTANAPPPGATQMAQNQYTIVGNMAVITIAAGQVIVPANFLVSPVAFWTNLTVGSLARLDLGFVAGFITPGPPTTITNLPADSIKIVLIDAAGNTLITLSTASGINIDDTETSDMFTVTTSTISAYIVGLTATPIVAPSFRFWAFDLTLELAATWPGTTLFQNINYYDDDGVIKMINPESTTWSEMFLAVSPVNTNVDDFTHADFLLTVSALFNNTTGRAWANVFDWWRNINPSYSIKYVNKFLTGVVTSANVDSFLATPILWFISNANVTGRNSYFLFWREVVSDLQLFSSQAQEDSNLAGTLRLNS